MGTVLFAVTDAGRMRELTEGLTSDGHDVVMAADCERSLEAVVSLAPHAVVVDASLAAKDGFEACRTFRDMSVAPLIVLADDASVDEVDELLAFSSGADDYIRMPCSPESCGPGLLRRCAEWSGRAGSLWPRHTRSVRSPWTPERDEPRWAGLPCI